MAEPAFPRYQSGIQFSTGSKSSGDANDLIRAANEDFACRVASHLDVPIAVLAEQRDAALGECFRLSRESEHRVDDLRHQFQLELESTKHLLEDQLKNVERELLEARSALVSQARTKATPSTLLMADGRRSSVPPASPATESTSQGAQTGAPVLESGSRSISETAGEREQSNHLAALRSKYLDLQQQLKGATDEAEDARRDALQLQIERDEALAATDDTRAQMQTEIDAARDEAIEAERERDRMRRELDDLQDRTRDEALRFKEEIQALREELRRRREGGES